MRKYMFDITSEKMNFNMMKNAFTLSACHIQASVKKEVKMNEWRFFFKSLQPLSHNFGGQFRGEGGY